MDTRVKRCPHPGCEERIDGSLFACCRRHEPCCRRHDLELTTDEAAERYETHHTFPHDAVEALCDAQMRGDAPAGLLVLVEAWYRTTASFACVVEDVVSGDRELP
jgi:hypothetical protein